MLTGLSNRLINAWINVDKIIKINTTKSMSSHHFSCRRRRRHHDSTHRNICYSDVSWCQLKSFLSFRFNIFWEIIQLWFVGGDSIVVSKWTIYLKLSFWELISVFFTVINQRDNGCQAVSKFSLWRWSHDSIVLMPLARDFKDFHKHYT